LLAGYAAKQPSGLCKLFGAIFAGMDHGYRMVDLGFRVSTFLGDFDCVVDRFNRVGSAAAFVFGVLNVILRLLEKWDGR